MGWIKTDYRFQPHSAIFYITHKQMLMERIVLEAIHRNQDPDHLENAVRDLVLRYRPELAGCCIWSMEWSMREQQWQFLIEHGSLPRSSPGEELKPRPLDPAYERDLELSNGLESP